MYRFVENYVHASSSIIFSTYWTKLDNTKIGNLKRKNRDHKQDEDAGNLQILLHLRSLFWLHV